MNYSKAITFVKREIAQGKYTQIELAKAIDVDQSQVSRILSGRYVRKSGHAEKLCKYAYSRMGLQINQQEPDDFNLTKLTNELAIRRPELVHVVAGMLRALLESNRNI